MDIDDRARPSRRPIFDTARNTQVAPLVERDRSTARGRLQNVDRHTSQALESMGTDARYVRCNRHMLHMLGICSIKPYLAPSVQCSPLTTMSGAACQQALP